MFLFFSVFCIFHDKINELSHPFWVCRICHTVVEQGELHFRWKEKNCLYFLAMKKRA